MYFRKYFLYKSLRDLFCSHNHAVELLLHPLYRWINWGSEKYNLQTVCGRSWTGTEVCWNSRSCRKIPLAFLQVLYDLFQYPSLLCLLSAWSILARVPLLPYYPKTLSFQGPASVLLLCEVFQYTPASFSLSLAVCCGDPKPACLPATAGTANEGSSWVCNREKWGLWQNSKGNSI